MSDLSEIYDVLQDGQDIVVMPMRMREERLRLPSDDEEFAIMIADYFLADCPIMLFAPKLVMEAWFFAGRAQPGKDLPVEVHVPSELISEHGGVPILKMRFINEQEYAEQVAEIQKGQISRYISHSLI